MGGSGQDACALNVSRWLVLLLLAPLSVARAGSLDLRAEPEFASARAALDPVNFVLAQASPGERPAPAAQAAAPHASSFALMRLFFQDSTANGGTRLAPIRWAGNAFVEHTVNRGSDGMSRRQTVEHVNFNAASYIMQPWLAQVNGNLGLVASQSGGRSGDEASGGVSTRARGFNVTGGGGLSVFPTSRFPFTAMFQTSDSRTSGEVTSSDYVSRVLTLRQSYRAPLGRQTYSASFNRSALSGSFGSDTVTSMEATMQRLYDEHVVDAVGYLSRNRQAGGAVDTGRISARHSYRPEDGPYTIDSNAGLTLADFSAMGGFRTHYFQLNSFGTWRPGEESPWFLTGGAQFSDAAIAGGDSARLLAVHVAGSYALSQHANLAAGVNVAWNGSQVVSGQTVAANYSPAPISFAGFAYSWGAGASAGNHTGGSGGGQQNVGTTASHQLSRPLPLSKAVTLSANVGQSAGWQYDSRGNTAYSLSHTLGLSLDLRPSAGSHMALSVSGGESRTYGDRDRRFRMLNAQMNGQLQLGVFSVLSANMTVQAVRQASEVEQEGGQTSVYRSGMISYRHTRLFGVPRLRLVMDTSFADLQLESRLLGDVNAPREQVTELYEGRLEYDIGRLDFKLGTRLATIAGKRDRQIFFRVNRQFGFY